MNRFFARLADPRSWPDFARDLNCTLRERPWAFLLLFFALYGFAYVDHEDFEALAPNPFVTHPVLKRQFLHSSPLTYFLGWPLYRLTGYPTAYVLVILIGFAFLAAAFLIYLRGLSRDQKLTVFYVVVSSPILLILLRWLGKNDAYLLAFYLLFRSFDARGVGAAASALLMVLAHREMGAIILAGDFILRGRISISVILAIASGFALIRMYQLSLTARPVTRTGFLSLVIDDAILGWETIPLTHFVLGFGWFWTFLLGLAREPGAGRRWLATGLCFAAAAIASDFTRVFVVCGAPLLLHTAETIAARTPVDPEPKVTGWPFPLLFLVQAQIDNVTLVRESMWGWLFF